MSPSVLPVRPDTLSTSAVVPYKPLPFVALTFVDDDRFLADCTTDCAEFWRARADGSRCITDGAGLLPPRSFAAANVATIGEEATDGGLIVDRFVFVLRIETVSVHGISKAIALTSFFRSRSRLDFLHDLSFFQGDHFQACL